MYSLQDRIRGSLIGGAVGDALGYPVEFMGEKQIVHHFGERGITRFSLNHNGKAVVSDDTHLFSAMGCPKSSSGGPTHRIQ